MLIFVFVGTDGVGKGFWDADALASHLRNLEPSLVDVEPDEILDTFARFQYLGKVLEVDIPSPLYLLSIDEGEEMFRMQWGRNPSKEELVKLKDIFGDGLNEGGVWDILQIACRQLVEG